MLKGVPVGTKISLLTRGGVRYEGVLYELNRIKETMSVKSVRSFGTEGRGVCRPRRDGNPEVSASNEIFDCMTFRGADLIDVKLLNAPKVSTEARTSQRKLFLWTHRDELLERPSWTQFAPLHVQHQRHKYAQLCSNVCQPRALCQQRCEWQRVHARRRLVAWRET
eukprot:GEMP01072230.1.p1 GENE.GEMP01072230.1~~GEMP01072230.1.p1  ORF type:complete len:166 (+),score=21.28 GEMP01072230.1:184-681(+)